MKLFLINITYTMGEIYFGYAIIYLSVIDFSTIVQIYSISMDPFIAEGLLVGCIPFGAIFGSFIAKTCISHFSRR